ncbi:MAG TPA: ATP-binding protein [Thermoanaerobaculia bacterium]|nr:ATP-binding protein [Thermoanaerobaculia bacterium]
MAAPDANFWAVFESAPDAYLLLATDAPRFTMVAANEARLRATMTRREDVVGRPLFEVFPDNPTDPGATGVRNLRASLDEVLRTGKPHRMALQKYDIRTPSGDFEERYWDPLNSPVFDSDGTLIYIIHRVEDVTEEVRKTAALADERRARERYRLLIDMIPQNVWTTDPDGRHTYFSRRWYEFSGATLEESRGEGWTKWIHPEDRERTFARWRHSLETGEPYEIEYRFRGADGEYHWFLGKAMPLRNEAGQIVEWFGTATDISERKKLEQERERLLASRAALIRGFSHDVRNPLTVASMSAQLLELAELSEEDHASVERIRRSIRTSLRLIDDLLEVARAEAGQLDIECIPTDVGRAAHELADDFKAPAAAVGIELVAVAPEGLQADTDSMRMRQILTNLLSNAVKYAPRSKVTVDAELRGDRIAVTVTDTGPGIPADKREAIFEEYTRLDPEAQQGAGIGLAISRRIARLLGGDLTVESEAGRGATFTLWLPPAGSN